MPTLLCTSTCLYSDLFFPNLRIFLQDPDQLVRPLILPRNLYRFSVPSHFSFHIKLPVRKIFPLSCLSGWPLNVYFPLIYQTSPFINQAWHFFFSSYGMCSLRKGVLMPPWGGAILEGSVLLIHVVYSNPLVLPVLDFECIISVLCWAH